MKEKLYRSNKDVVITGVCGGLGEYFGIEAILIRIGFVLLTIWGGSGVLIYVLMSILISKKTGKGIAMGNEERIEELVEDVGGRVKNLVEEVRESPKGDGGKMVVGVMLLIWGGVEILKKSGWLMIDLGEIVMDWWPIGIIIAGLGVIFGKKWWTVAAGVGLVWLAAWFILGNNLRFFR